MSDGCSITYSLVWYNVCPGLILFACAFPYKITATRLSIQYALCIKSTETAMVPTGNKTKIYPFERHCILIWEGRALSIHLPILNHQELYFCAWCDVEMWQYERQVVVLRGYYEEWLRSVWKRVSWYCRMKHANKYACLTDYMWCHSFLRQI